MAAAGRADIDVELFDGEDPIFFGVAEEVGRG